MKDDESLVDIASELINMEPLPDDAEEQLKRLIEQASTSYGRYQLGCLAEALFVIRHS
ncbi:MAG: hypothetical protein J6569_06955 [Gilliamella sp.]|uniref:Uncharacterized protein n=1 Tax=Gilliamella intestini TaxID=1798183 RepID=A0A1C4DP95_9GAMM|nr:MULTISPECIES: hypothetical protein [Gilliamella]MCO6539856.1 hypothetical protein [Gilliamella sp.]SCC33132.1 hypothetical protein GA0061080_10902 [Gilliamella intestini]